MLCVLPENGGSVTRPLPSPLSLLHPTPLCVPTSPTPGPGRGVPLALSLGPWPELEATTGQLPVSPSPLLPDGGFRTSLGGRDGLGLPGLCALSFLRVDCDPPAPHRCRLNVPVTNGCCVRHVRVSRV